MKAAYALPLVLLFGCEPDAQDACLDYITTLETCVGGELGADTGSVEILLEEYCASLAGIDDNDIVENYRCATRAIRGLDCLDASDREKAANALADCK